MQQSSTEIFAWLEYTNITITEEFEITHLENVCISLLATFPAIFRTFKHGSVESVYIYN
jgi:hypothetical protein